MALEWRSVALMNWERQSRWKSVTHNMDLETFRVLVRLKPSSQGCLLRLHEGHVIANQISVPEMRGSVFKEQTFAFENVFVGSTLELYAKGVQAQVRRLATGCKTTCMAYGATGSGKTYTMFGNLYHSGAREPGIVGLALRDALQEFSERKCTLTLSYLEIYNERLNDLLAEDSPSLGIVEDPLRGVYVPGLTEKVLTNYEGALELVRLGNSRRKQAHTKANAHSTRSHAMLTLTAEFRGAKLHLLDLAGSERAAKGEGRGIRVVEGGNINKSLLTLGNCITILSKRKGAFVPYRDSKLTRLIKDSLGGTALTTFIACVSPSPSSLEETLQTLKYAERAQCIKVSPEISRDSFVETEIDRESITARRQVLVELQETTENRIGRRPQNREDLEYFSRLAESLKDQVALMDILLGQLKRKDEDVENQESRKRLDCQIQEAKWKQKLLQAERTGVEKDRIIGEMAKELHAMKVKLKTHSKGRSMELHSDAVPKRATKPRTCDPSPLRPVVPRLQLSSLSELRKAHKEAKSASHSDAMQFLSGYSSARSVDSQPTDTARADRSTSVQAPKLGKRDSRSFR